jgi:hypothetical protein
VKRLIGIVIFLARAVHAQDLAGFEKVLFPVLSVAGISGPYGTFFQPRLEATSPVDIAFYPASGPMGTPLVGIQPSGVGLIQFFELAARSGGRILYFDRANLARLSFFYELTTRGPDGSMHRTTLPVVREQEFKRGPSTILGLTTGPKYDLSGGPPPKVVGFVGRNHLRIYDVDNSAQLEVAVRVTVRPLEAYGPFAQYRLRVATRDTADMTYPYYLDILLPDLCITAPSGATCQDYPLEVSVEPSDPNIRYWAFASTTDNVSGETSIFFPQ